jgi:iron complex transport system permease protein
MTVVVDAAPVVRPVAVARSRRARRALLGSGWSRAGGLLVAAGVLVVVVLCSVALGSKSISLGTVWQALVEADGSNDHLIVRSLRVPRTLLGLGVGSSLGLAGAVMQGVTRNPLADPGILGVDAGAALAVVVAIHTLDVTTLTGYVWFAFAGAALAGVVVYLLGATGRGGATPVKLALAGAALSALLGALISAVLLLDVQTLDRFRFWVVGSLAGRDADVVAQAAPFLAAGLTALAAALAVFAWSLTLGDYPLPLADVVGSLVGRGDEGTDFVVHTLRLPRGLVGLLVGAAFGLSGANLPAPGSQPAGQPPTSSASTPAPPPARCW